MKHVKVALKRECDTRWSSYKEAVCALASNIDGVLDALEELKTADAKTVNMKTQAEAAKVEHNLLDFSFLLHLSFWSKILPEYDNVQKHLQKEGLSLQECSTRIKDLMAFLEEERDALVDDSIAETRVKCEELGISMERRVKRKKRMPGELARDAGLSWTEELRRGLFQVIFRF